MFGWSNRDTYKDHVEIICICKLIWNTDCPNPSIVDNGICNDEANNAECNYDGVSNALVGDGFCHDEMNNNDCNFDGGDCCLLNMNSGHCSDCLCYHQETCLAGVTHEFLGNGICNDETNNAACNYDGLDCCKYQIVHSWLFSKFI